MKNHLFFAFAIPLFFSSCTGLKTLAPVAKTETPLVALKPSYISLPIDIDVKELEKKINHDLTGNLYNDDNYEPDNLKIKAWKKENFTINVVSNELFYTVPLKIGIQYKKLIEFPEVFADITLKFKTHFVLNKDWTLSTKTSVLGFDWENSKGISVGGVELPMKSISDLLLNANKETLGAEIDKGIKSQLNLKSYANNAWNMLHKPLLINNDPKVWLKMSPSELSCVPIVGKNGKILLTLALKTINEIVVNDAAPTHSITKLPELKIVQKLSPELSLNTSVDVPFTKITELANKELLEKKFSSGKKSITIKNIKTYSSGDFLVVELLVEGSIKGYIYFKGKPIYNSTSKTLEIKEIDFDLDTKNKLYKSAEWLLHNNIIKMMEEKLIFPLNDKLMEVKKMANDNIKENRSIKGILINGNVDELDIDQISLSPTSLKAFFVLKGKLFVSVDELSKM